MMVATISPSPIDAYLIWGLLVVNGGLVPAVFEWHLCYLVADVS